MIGTGENTLCLRDGRSDGCVCGLGTGPASSLIIHSYRTDGSFSVASGKVDVSSLE